jgi:hypothetical protein
VAGKPAMHMKDAYEGCIWMSTMRFERFNSWLFAKGYIHQAEQGIGTPAAEK